MSKVSCSTGSLSVVHSMKGRLRLKVKRTLKPGRLSSITGCFPEKITGIINIRVNEGCGSIVIRYNPGTVSEKNILAGLNSLFSRKPVRSSQKKDSAGNVHVHEHDLKKTAISFSALTALGTGIFIRQSVLGIAVSQAFFSLPGIIVTLFALPMIRDGLKSLKEKKISLESVLGGGIIASVMAGEALAAFEILWVTSAGHLLQAWVTEKSRRSIRNILEITEKETYILVDGVEVSIPVAKVCAGDTVVLHTGEKIAVDGIITKGEALVDESPINGRSDHMIRGTGDTVYAGTFVSSGLIYVRAEQVGDRTYLSRILHMVEDSLENRAPVEGVADRLSRTLVKTGTAATLATFFITGSLWRAFTVMLVMACPCATILAASTAVSAALSNAARRGILIKGGRYLEEISDVPVVCFDKTGTLTTMEPEIRYIETAVDLSENALLELACSTEMHNSHPLALAIKKEAAIRGIESSGHDICEYFPGLGVRSEKDGHEILAGSHRFMKKRDVIPEQVMHDYLETHKKNGLTLVFLAVDGEFAGVIGFANQEKPDAAPVLEYFRKDGVSKTVLITGDSKYSALEMAGRLGFTECHYSVMPEEKAVIVRDLKGRAGRVIMVGDGINDALALSEADIGIAMGAGGSEVAIEAADIALVKDDLADLVHLHSLSRKTLAVVNQNFWIATLSNIAGAGLGAAGMLSPVMAGFIHLAHTLGILLNSARLLFFESEFSAQNTVHRSLEHRAIIKQGE